MENVYEMDNMSATIKNCFTNIAGSKPMRTFGIVEAVFIIESIVNDVAVKCGLPALQVSICYALRTEGVIS